MKHYLGIDLRPAQVALARVSLSGRDLVVEKRGCYKRAPHDWDVVVSSAKEFGCDSAAVVVSLDSQNVTTQGQAIPPYIESRDIAGYAELTGQREATRPERPRRVRYNLIGRDHMAISIANDKAVSETALAFEDRGVMLEAMVDPAFAWLNSFAPCGIIDDGGGTTMITYPTQDGTPAMDVVSRKYDQKGLISAALAMLRKKPRGTGYDHLLYFGDATSARFLDLRSALVAYNVELYPVAPPSVSTMEPWTFALALAYCGVAHQ